MPMTARMDLDKSKADRGLDQFEDKAVKTGKRINKRLNDSFSSIGKSGSGSRQTAALAQQSGFFESAQKGIEAAGVSGDRLGKFGALAGKLTPVAAGAAAAATAWQVAVKILEDYRKKLEEAVSLAEKHVEAVEKSGAEQRNWIGESRSTLDFLQGVSGKELSFSEFDAAAEAVERLQERYTGLGITVDETARRIIVSEEDIAAVAKSNHTLDVSSRMREVDALKVQYDELRKLSENWIYSPREREQFQLKALALIPRIKEAEAAAARAFQDDADKAVEKYRKGKRSKTLDQANAINSDADRIAAGRNEEALADSWSRMSPEARIEEMTEVLGRQNAKLRELRKKAEEEADLLKAAEASGGKLNLDDVAETRLKAAKARLAVEKQAAEVQKTELKLAGERAELEKQTASWRQSQEDQVQAMREQIMTLAGRGKDASVSRALRDAERGKGSALTDEEKTQVRELAELNWQLSNMEKSGPGDIPGGTNELTARGGFASVGVSAADRVSQAIADNSAKTNALLNKIEQRLEKLEFVQ